MLGLFAPRCPLATAEKFWVEYRMGWLVETLGVDRMLSAEVILPEARFFPEPYRGTDEDVRRIFDRFCGYMRLDPARFDLEVVPDEQIPGLGGLYEPGDRPRILITQSRLADVERLLAAIAHELAHDILLGGGLITVDVEDHEQVTDLLPVFLGLGVFAANATVRDFHYFEQGRQFHRVTQQGYLPSRMLGYALALFCFVRGEDRPPWLRHLRLDAADPLRKGLRYLRRTGDSLLRPGGAGHASMPVGDAELIAGLAHPSPTFRMKAILDAGRFEGPPPPAILGAVIDRLRDRDDDVVAEAARAVSWYGQAAQAAVPDLIRGLASRSAEVRWYSAIALPSVEAPAARVVPELTRLLHDHHADVAEAAVTGLRHYAHEATTAVPALVEVFRIKEVACLDSNSLVDAIVAIGPTDEAVEATLAPIDPEIAKRMRRALRAARFRAREHEPEEDSP